MPTPTPEVLHDLLSAYADSDAATVARALVAPHETPHRLTPDGRSPMFTWCALDALIVAHLLRCDARLDSRPPHPADHAPLTWHLRRGTLDADPGNVLSFPVATADDGRHFTERFCPDANLFASLPDYRTWAATRARPTTPVTPVRADEIARSYAADVRARAERHGSTSGPWPAAHACRVGPRTIPARVGRCVGATRPTSNDDHRGAASPHRRPA